MLQRVIRYFSARPLLLLLLTADFVFIAVHVWLWTKGNVPWDHHLGRDGSNPEKLQYVKWLTSTLLCAWAFARQRDALYLAWAALFFYLLLDDSQEIHETVSLSVAEEINAHNVLQKYLERKQFPIKKTREIAAIVLFIYGVILPILNCFRPFASMFRRLRLIVPPPALILGFFAGALLAWFDKPTGREEEIGEFLFGLCFALLVPLWLLQQRYVLVPESPGLARAVPI